VQRTEQPSGVIAIEPRPLEHGKLRAEIVELSVEN
jgi:hypothetical protein